MANQATGGSRKLVLPIVIGLILLAALGFVLAGFLKDDKVETADSPTSAEPTLDVGTTAAAESVDADSIDSLLAQARAAHEKNQYVDPEGTNEVELYLRVLEKDPNNRNAQEALLEVIPFATDQAESYIRQGNIPQAERTLGLLRKADPNSVVLISLAGKIEQMQRLQTDREAEIIAQQQQAALFAQQRAAAQQTAATETPAADITAADEPTTTAGTTPTTTTAATPPPRPRDTPAATPPPTIASTTPTPSVATSSGPQDQNFKLTKRVAPTYPQRALRQRITGWVDLSFTITATGDVTGIEIVNSQPRREFDREAIRALSQWKFSPKIEGGKPVAAVARQRLEFKL